MDTENSSFQTPETEPVTPTYIQPPQPTNGVLRRHPLVHIHHFGHPVVVTYKECTKNFAASAGGHVVDGCGEFFLAPTSNVANPQSLHCDACGCHRNFHRREEGYSFTQPLVPRNNHIHIVRDTHESTDESLLPISSAGPHMLMAQSHGQGLGAVPANPNMNIGGGVSRKRFRTKFTQVQKGKMLELAEKVGWKIQKRNEVIISESCIEIGVEKCVFNVWMHNNKKTIGKKETSIADMTSPRINVINDVGNGGALSEGNFENCVGSSEGHSGYGVGLCEGSLENEDHVHVEDKGQEDTVVAGNNDGSSPSATA